MYIDEARQRLFIRAVRVQDFRGREIVGRQHRFVLQQECEQEQHDRGHALLPQVHHEPHRGFRGDDDRLLAFAELRMRPHDFVRAEGDFEVGERRRAGEGLPSSVTFAQGRALMESEPFGIGTFCVIERP